MSAAARLRIGCAAGFWGDSRAGAAQLVRRGDIDVLVFDFLAEITLAILARIRARRPELGHVPDFVDTLVPLLPEIAQRRIRVVSNGGGMNPAAAGALIGRAIAEAGLDLTVAVVTGDDVLPLLPAWRGCGLSEIGSGRPLAEDLATANAYLGARPIARALDEGADIVVTGRCADSALVLGPLVSAFGWAFDDYDRLAAGSLAGHLLECGAQVTGGLFTDWERVPGWDDIGFPIAICEPDGTFLITKPEGTGGLIDPLAVAEQLLYEIGDPAAYQLPDVVCDLTGVRLEAAGSERVRVSGARGRAPTGWLKVSATRADGFRVIGTVTIGGREAAAKAERVGAAILARTRRLLAEARLADFAETSIEVLGAEATYGPHARPQAKQSREVVLKIGARHPQAAVLEMLAREIAPAATAMAQGLTGFFAGRPSVQPVLRHVAFLCEAARVPATVSIGERRFEVPNPVPHPEEPAGRPCPPAAVSTNEPAAGLRHGPAEAGSAQDAAAGDLVGTVPLIALAVGRSGDKGDSANIGIIARRPEHLPYLRAALTAEAVKHWFAHTGATRVERFDVAGIHALNFLLHDALGGGGVASLRIDPQGKAFAQMLMDFPVPVPAAIAAEWQRSGAAEGRR